jgi:hypothetical protein
MRQKQFWSSVGRRGWRLEKAEAGAGGGGRREVKARLAEKFQISRASVFFMKHPKRLQPLQPSVISTLSTVGLCQSNRPHHNTMGHDANIKSSQAERRLRQVLYLSLITLSLSIFVIMSLLQKDAVSLSVKINTSRVRNKNKESPFPQTATDHNRANLHAEMTQRVAHLDEAMRAIKKTDVIMETDKDALKMTALLQDATRQLIQLRYGQIADPAKNYRVRLELEFQKSIPGETALCTRHTL